MSKSSSSPGRNTVATGGSTSPKSPKFGRQAAPSTVSITSKSAKVAAKPTSKDDVDTTSHHLYALCSISYLGAMLASNKALQWVSYPTQVGIYLTSVLLN